MIRRVSVFALFFPAILALYAWLRPNEVVWAWRRLSAASPGKTYPFTGPLPACPDCHVLVVSLDTLRADRAGAMPNLQKIAQRSVVFDRAYANGYYTTPSHMTVFTSLYPARHRIETKMFSLRAQDGQEESFRSDAPESLSDRYVTWAEIMRRAGYDTYWNGPLTLRYLKPEYGFGRGFNHFAPPPFGRGLSLGHVPVGGFNPDALKPLQARKKAFVFLHSYIAHSPYIIHQDSERFLRANVPYNQNLLEYFRERVQSTPEVLFLQSHETLPAPEQVQRGLAACTRYQDMRECFGRYSNPDGFWHAAGQMQHRKARREIVDLALESSVGEAEMFEEAYTQATQELDRQLGQMWSALEASGQLDRTLVVFFSDHGETLFERGEVGHGSFHEEVARIPMMIYHPKLTGPVSVPQIASLVDLLPATLDLLGLPPPPQAQGRVPWKNPQNYAWGSSLGSVFVTDGRWKLITNNLKVDHLYDLHVDPHEEHNLAGAWSPLLREAYRRMDEAKKMALVENSL